jgi:glutamyl-tRNA reductase
VRDTASASAWPLIVSANHRSTSAALLDQLFLTEAEIPEFLGALRAGGIEQAIVLSTCDRVEVQIGPADPALAVPSVVAAFARRTGLGEVAIRDQLQVIEGPPALRHVFAVASALESRIVGEPQVLGQVKEAHRRSLAAAMVGSELEAALQAAYTAAKRVRTETTIGQRPVSLVSAAVELARNVHGELDRCTALLIGAGDMGDLMIEQLQTVGLKRVLTTGANPARAEEQARRFGGHVASFEALAATLAQADIAVCTMGAGRHILTRAIVGDAVVLRRRRPLLLLDIAVPSDVEPAADEVEGAFRYDLDGLEQVAMTGRSLREAASAEAWAIVDAELAAFTRSRSERGAVPAIVALRGRFEVERARALREAGGDAERATELLINRLLHAPSEALRKAAAESGDAATAEQLLAKLFALELPADKQENDM